MTKLTFTAALKSNLNTSIISNDSNKTSVLKTVMLTNLKNTICCNLLQVCPSVPPFVSVVSFVRYLNVLSGYLNVSQLNLVQM